MPEPLALRKKRLLYRARYRGTQELDILVGGYVAAHIDELSETDLTRFEVLLEIEETELQAYLMGQLAIPPEIDADLVAAIRAFRQRQARAQR